MRSGHTANTPSSFPFSIMMALGFSFSKYASRDKAESFVLRSMSGRDSGGALPHVKPKAKFRVIDMTLPMNKSTTFSDSRREVIGSTLRHCGSAIDQPIAHA